MTNPRHVVSMFASNEGCLTENCTKCLLSTTQGKGDGRKGKQNKTKKKNEGKKHKATTATQNNMQLSLSGSIYFRIGPFKMKLRLTIISRGKTQGGSESVAFSPLLSLALLSNSGSGEVWVMCAVLSRDPPSETMRTGARKRMISAYLTQDVHHCGQIN